MGLAERQMMAKLKDQWLPDYQTKLNEALGCPVEIVMDEASFATVDSISYLGTLFFDRFTSGVREICSDKLGKEALQEAMKKVVIHHTTAEKSHKLDLSGGTFSATGKWDGSLGTDTPGSSEYKEFLMTKL
jgi:hypothetical protein